MSKIPKMVLYGWENNKWTQQAISILDFHGWNYQFELANTCNGRDPNTQYVRITPTVRFLLDNGLFVSIEGINAIKKMFDDPKGKRGILISLSKTQFRPNADIV